jgi:glutathione peroxidase
MKKSDVNGDNTNEVYEYLKSQKAGILGLTRIKVCGMLRLASNLSEIWCVQWNFEKFLVDKEGNVVNRWASTTTPAAIDAEVAKLL